MTLKKDKQKSTKSTAAKGKKSQSFSDEELAAMKERSREMKKGSKVDGESDVRAKLAEMEEPDRSIGERLHTIIRANAPSLSPKTWYGMPAYATKDGKIVCFFQPAKKFNARYATLGFNDTANIDDGSMFPVAFALKELNAAEEAKIAALVKKAVS